MAVDLKLPSTHAGCWNILWKMYLLCELNTCWRNHAQEKWKKKEKKKRKKRFKAFSLSVSVCLSVCLYHSVLSVKPVEFCFKWNPTSLATVIATNIYIYIIKMYIVAFVWERLLPLVEKDNRLMNPKINHWIGPCYTMTLTRNRWAIAECQQVKTA